MAKTNQKAGKTKTSRFAGIRKKLASPIATVALFAVAAGLLLFSTVGGARAALIYASDNYSAEIRMSYIGVTLLEKGQGAEKSQVVASRDYSKVADGQWHGDEEGELLGWIGQENFRLGERYEEVLSVQNTGQIDEYVRVTIYKYWLDAAGKKTQELSPDLIELQLENVGNGPEDKWIEDKEAETAERTVLYYKEILEAGAVSDAFSSSLTVNADVASKVIEERTEKVVGDTTYTTVTSTYAYDGYRFVVKAQVDAVQTHSAEDAIWSAWGRRVTVDSEDKTLSLKTADDMQAVDADRFVETEESGEQGTGTDEDDTGNQGTGTDEGNTGNQGTGTGEGNTGEQGTETGEGNTDGQGTDTAGDNPDQQGQEG
ncbi:MAG: hypothetical protein NC541_13770 [bacterium]|nr:hypothetical protein [bacterium]